MPKYQIPVTWLNCLAYAAEQYPLHTPKRWILVQEFMQAHVNFTGDVHNSLLVTLGSGHKLICFECKATHCREVYFLYARSAPAIGFQQLQEFARTFLHNSGKHSVHKPTILLPKEKVCPLCKKPIEIDHRPTFPQVFTKAGVATAASFHARCSHCRLSRMHSFYTQDSQTGGPASKLYLLQDVDKYFMVTRETVFEVALLEQFHTALTVSGCSFGSIVNAYNAEHASCPPQDCVPGHSCSTGPRHDKVLLHRDRMEDTWFVWRLLLQRGYQEPLRVSQQQLGHRPDLEDLCKKAYDDLCSKTNQWALHKCSTKGCQEGYLTIDGNAKLRRAVCAVPKSAVKMGPSMPRVFNTCPNSPLMGGKNRAPSKYCKEHQDLIEDDSGDSLNIRTGCKGKEDASKISRPSGKGTTDKKGTTTKRTKLPRKGDKDDTLNKKGGYQGTVLHPTNNPATGPGISDIKGTSTQGTSYPLDKILTISLWDMNCKTPLRVESTKELPSPEDSSIMTGCKDEEKLTKFHETTAGVLAFVKPCGVIVKLQEMYTCESSSQVFNALLALFEEHPHVCRIIGYDRACELHPFLCKLAEKGNPGAGLLLDKCDFLVDIFHVTKHVRDTCMPLDGPNCRYHPQLPRFSHIHGTNTESAEQAFSWLNRFKTIVRKMTVHKFKWMLQEAIHARNTHVAYKMS